jgi:uncharacterized protein YcbX
LHCNIEGLEAMPIRLKDIYRYPVKGLSAERLESVHLTAGETIPGDRRFAIAHGSTLFDCGDPKWMPKQNFLMLAKDEKLAQLETRFDPESCMLTILRQGKQVVRADVGDIMGRTVVGQFFASFMAGATRGTPKFIEAAGHSFSDLPGKVLSFINLASVSDLERVLRQPVHPLRFRANAYLEGLPAWEERGWVGRSFHVGQARFQVVDEIERCAATNVNPESAERDMNIPLTLRKGFSHHNMGLYAEVIEDGDLKAGMELDLD